MGRGILIIDPQCDFITGTLPVPGAMAAMDNLATFLLNNRGRYALNILTEDSHPPDHSSFMENGGQWPAHCVKDTPGALIWPRLSQALADSGAKTCRIAKGENAAREEYSIFIPHAARMDELIKRYAIEGLDICGLAGDVCVLRTLRDGISRYGRNMFTVLEDFCPSLDGGQALREFCEREKISCVRS